METKQNRGNLSERCQGKTARSILLCKISILHGADPGGPIQDLTDVDLRYGSPKTCDSCFATIILRFALGKLLEKLLSKR